MAAPEVFEDGFYKMEDMVDDLKELDLSRKAFPDIVSAAVTILADVRFLGEKTIIGNDTNYAAAVVSASWQQWGVPADVDARHEYAEAAFSIRRQEEIARAEAEHVQIEADYAGHPELIAWLKN